ncbi:Xylose isomerase-like TIM barrel [Paenibacillus sp. UNCCL117]|uniref:sugar phosphate isomerase/epimerase family protein n=1 Tax=unclassified Paenibacillus TaxID=185978 RepID=UPI000884A8F6|nr:MULTISPECIES: TIM barrel protein [unclassified Paenibacillus]SDC28109.1 Xylose isomerase-like TIM barrel [Paenibacillus sp. cl123]SFW20478.1 Xylose isomerase-like TIM barrel [Paenibacillus sp. UNCCL117]
MKTIIAKAFWGMDGSVEEKVRRIAEGGYDAVEAPVPDNMKPGAFRALLDEHNLSYIAQMSTIGGDEADEHAAVFGERLRQAAEYGPLFVNCHTGRDRMEADEQLRLFGSVLQHESEVGIAVAHETHRSRCMYTPWTTAKLLKAYPELNICADFSHWVCVTESFLQASADDVELAIRRALHIHGRVGYIHGPQVADPRAPEVAPEVSLHEGWWRRIYEARQSAGAEQFTYTPEYGPPGYMHVQPYTRQPVADLWEICDWGRSRVPEWLPAK